jgi:hypothetical protein
LLFPLPAVILFPKTGTQSKMTREQWLRSGAIYQEVQKAAERREGEPQAVQHKTGIFAMKRRNLISHLSSPSKSMMDFADELTQEPKSLALDAGCGFGRNAVALALRGLSARDERAVKSPGAAFASVDPPSASSVRHEPSLD